MRAIWPVGIVIGVVFAGAFLLYLGDGQDAGSSGDGVAIVRVAPVPPGATLSAIVPGDRAGAAPAGSAEIAERRDIAIVRALAGRGTPEQTVLANAMAVQDRDAATAAPVETGMETALAHVPTLVGAGGPPRVTCVDTACEVTGIAAAGQSPSTVEQALRDPALVQAMLERGYMPGPITVADAAEGTTFVMYLNDEM